MVSDSRSPITSRSLIIFCRPLSSQILSRTSATSHHALPIHHVCYLYDWTTNPSAEKQRCRVKKTLASYKTYRTPDRYARFYSTGHLVRLLSKNVAVLTFSLQSNCQNDCIDCRKADYSTLAAEAGPLASPYIPQRRHTSPTQTLVDTATDDDQLADTSSETFDDNASLTPDIGSIDDGSSLHTASPMHIDSDYDDQEMGFGDEPWNLPDSNSDNDQDMGFGNEPWNPSDELPTAETSNGSTIVTTRPTTPTRPQTHEPIVSSEVSRTNATIPDEASNATSSPRLTTPTTTTPELTTPRPPSNTLVQTYRNSTTSTPVVIAGAIITDSPVANLMARYRAPSTGPAATITTIFDLPNFKDLMMNKYKDHLHKQELASKDKEHVTRSLVLANLVPLHHLAPSVEVRKRNAEVLSLIFERYNTVPVSTDIPETSRQSVKTQHKHWQVTSVQTSQTSISLLSSATVSCHSKTTALTSSPTPRSPVSNSFSYTKLWFHVSYVQNLPDRN
jgi:hypothetical protein